MDISSGGLFGQGSTLGHILQETYISLSFQTAKRDMMCIEIKLRVHDSSTGHAD